MQELQFDYYRGMEAEQYTFYRIPKVLFTAECFKSLSCEAKVLYGLLLDRMSLSIKNRWFDEEDRVYALHEGDLKIAGIPVDINPISREKTGTLKEYLKSAEEYLDEKQSHMEIPKNNQQTEQEATITFYVAECTEFPVLGEYHERLKTLREAMELYEKIPAERMNGIKGIGFRLEDGSIYDGNFDLMVMGEMQTEFINEIPQYRDSPLVQKAIADMEAILLEERPEQEVSEAIEKEEPQQPMPEVKKEEKAVQTAENRNPDTAAQESGRNPEGLQKQSAEPEKAAENAPKTDRGISGVSKKQSVLNALRERQARMRAQEKEKKGKQAGSHRGNT